MEANRIIDISHASKDDIVRDIDTLLQVQDERSFKAGIKEVVEWIMNESDYDCGHFILDIDQDIWNTKLKEWNVKTE